MPLQLMEDTREVVKYLGGGLDYRESRDWADLTASI